MFLILHHYICMFYNVYVPQTTFMPYKAYAPSIEHSFCLHGVWFPSEMLCVLPRHLYLFSSEILYYLLLYETDQEYIMISLPLATSPVQFKYLASLWAMTVFPLAGIPTNATIKGPNFF